MDKAQIAEEVLYNHLVMESKINEFPDSVSYEIWAHIFKDLDIQKFVLRILGVYDNIDDKWIDGEFVLPEGKREPGRVNASDFLFDAFNYDEIADLPLKEKAKATVQEILLRSAMIKEKLDEPDEA